MRLLLVALVLSLLVPVAHATSPRSPWEFGVTVDGTGKLGSVVTIELTILSHLGGDDVRLALEVPSSLSPPDQASHVLDFEPGQRRTLRWETTVQQYGFWAAQVIFTANPQASGQPVEPDATDVSYVAAAAYGFTHKTLSRVSDDPMEVIPGAAEGTVAFGFTDHGGGAFTLNATVSSTTEWVRWGLLSGGWTILSATNSTDGPGGKPLTLTLNDTLAPGSAAYGSVDFHALPRWDAPREVGEPAYAAVRCRSVSISYDEADDLAFTDHGECRTARANVPLPAAATLITILVGATLLRRRL